MSRALSRDRLGKAALVVWAPVSITLLAFFMVNHVIAMPSPSEERVFEALTALRPDASRHLVHVIYERCSCTNGLVDHLAERGPFQGEEERILYVGSAGSAHEATLRRRGFDVTSISAEALRDTMGIEAAPLFVVLTPETRYAGGYYALPATVNPEDERIYRELVSGRAVSPLPIYGCAVSPELQRSLDPLGVRY